MNHHRISQFESMRQRHSPVQTDASGFEIIKAKILEAADGHHQWPKQARATITHAIYMEPIPGEPGNSQPYWALPPRFYYQFGLGWPAPVTAWLNYTLDRRTDSICVGDADFPSSKPEDCVVAGLIDPKSLFSSYAPGELLVGFRQGVDEAAARQVVARELPDSRVLDVIWSIRVLQITCTPFDEMRQASVMEQAAEVQYAQVNPHVHLIVPGGAWKVAELLSATV